MLKDDLSGEMTHDVRIQKFAGDQVNVSPSEDAGKFILHADQTQAGNMPGFKLNQDIEIAIGVKILGQSRAKQRKAADLIPLAEVSELFGRNRYPEVSHHRPR